MQINFIFEIYYFSVFPPNLLFRTVKSLLFPNVCYTLLDLPLWWSKKDGFQETQTHTRPAGGVFLSGVSFEPTQNQEVTTSKIVTFFWCQFDARIWY